mmetsp:Transcript_11326/g.27645  ORF Transcript_11326/g.27645 Transcript_11326/m.27645 type:complete len:103 (-) Transcript_11326:310-618(-)
MQAQGIELSDDQKRLEHIVIQSEGGHQNLFIFAERQDFDTRPGLAGGKYGGEGYRGAGNHTGVPLTFPTGEKTPLEAGRWCPDGRGLGTHIMLNGLRRKVRV